MPADVIRFVDSIAASPALRLDLNDETSWWVKKFDAPPPRLRRSIAANAMRDGVNVGPDTYDSRTLTIELECRKSTQDAAATEIQKLWRELDRTNNWIQYQPNGLTKPVFFRTYRSDASQLEDVMAQAAMRTFTIEVLAEPFALGLLETQAMATVNNDPAAATNGLALTLPSILGDVAAPAVVRLEHTTGTFASVVLATQTSTGSVPEWDQLETVGTTLGADTTNPGGGPDAAMSGTGLNNYRRTSFAGTPGMATRLSISKAAARITWRVLAAVRRTDATSVMRARFVQTVSSGGAAVKTGATVTIPQTTARQLIDLGVIDSNRGALTSVGYSDAVASLGTALFGDFQAERVSGTGSLDWDYYILVPASESCLIATGGGRTSAGLVVDGVAEAVVPYVPGGNPLTGSASANGAVWGAAGGFPMVTPNATNRMVLLQSRSTGHTKADAASVYVNYWPRYLFIRPAAS